MRKEHFVSFVSLWFILEPQRHKEHKENSPFMGNLKSKLRRILLAY